MSFRDRMLQAGRPLLFAAVAASLAGLSIAATPPSSGRSGAQSGQKQTLGEKDQ